MAVDLQKLIDIDLLSYFKSKLDLLFANKVDKVNGKGLSDANFTQDEKTKLANIAAGAEVNVNADWSAVTGDAAILNKPSIPSKTSDLTNDSGFVTTADVATAISGKANSSTTLAGYGITDAYTKSEIDNKISAAMNYKGTKATIADLPSSGNSTGDVWHVTATNGEYAWNGSSWEELGTTIDLSGYVEESEVSLATSTDIDELFE